MGTAAVSALDGKVTFTMFGKTTKLCFKSLPLHLLEPHVFIVCLAVASCLQ